MSSKATPCRVSASSAPSTSGCVTASLKRLASDGEAPPGAGGLAREFSHQCASRWPSLLALRRADSSAFSSVSGARIGTRSLDAQPVALEADDLARIVRDRADRLEAEVEQDLRADAVVAEIGLEAELLVRLDGVGARVLQLVGRELVEQADAAPFLVEIDDRRRAPPRRSSASRCRSCQPQSQRSEWKTSPVRHRECMRASTCSPSATSPKTSATCSCASTSFR